MRGAKAAGVFVGNGSIITMAYFVVVHRCRGSLRYFVPRAPDVPSFRSYASNPFCVVTKSGRFLPTLPSNLNIPQPRLKDSLYPATPKTFKNLSFLPKINKNRVYPFISKGYPLVAFLHNKPDAPNSGGLPDTAIWQAPISPKPHAYKICKNRLANHPAQYAQKPKNTL